MSATISLSLASGFNPDTEATIQVTVTNVPASPLYQMQFTVYNVHTSTFTIQNLSIGSPSLVSVGDDVYLATISTPSSSDTNSVPLVITGYAKFANGHNSQVSEELPMITTPLTPSIDSVTRLDADTGIVVVDQPVSTTYLDASFAGINYYLSYLDDFGVNQMAQGFVNQSTVIVDASLSLMSYFIDAIPADKTVRIAVQFVYRYADNSFLSDISNTDSFPSSFTPQSPSNLEASIDYIGFQPVVTLNWTAPPFAPDYYDVTGYNVYRSSSPSSGFIQVATVLPEDGTTYTDTNVNFGLTYYYYVTTASNAVESDPSNTVDITTTSVASPQNVSLELVSTDTNYPKLVASWDAAELAPPVQYINVYYYYFDGEGNVQVGLNGELDPTDTSNTFYLPSDAPVGYGYYAVISFIYYTEQSASSTTDTVSIIAGEPISLTASNWETGGAPIIHISWQEPSNIQYVPIEQYNIEISGYNGLLIQDYVPASQNHYQVDGSYAIYVDSSYSVSVNSQSYSGLEVSMSASTTLYVEPVEAVANLQGSYNNVDKEIILTWSLPSSYDILPPEYILVTYGEVLLATLAGNAVDYTVGYDNITQGSENTYTVTSIPYYSPEGYVPRYSSLGVEVPLPAEVSDVVVNLDYDYTNAIDMTTTISWTLPGDTSGIDYYEVYQSATASTTGGTSVGSTEDASQTSVVVTGLTNFETWYYYVVSVGYSASSAGVLSDPVQTLIPATEPTNLTIAGDAESLVISLDAPTQLYGGSGYQYIVKVFASAFSIQIGSDYVYSYASSLSATITGLDAGDSYYYRAYVVTRNPSNVSTTIDGAMAQSSVVTLPTLVTSPYISFSYPNTYTVHWTLPGSIVNINNYTVYRTTDGTTIDGESLGSTGNSSSTSITVTGLTNFDMYQIYVVSVGTNATSSGVLSGAVQALIPATVPIDLTVNAYVDVLYITFAEPTDTYGGEPLQYVLSVFDDSNDTQVGADVIIPYEAGTISYQFDNGISADTTYYFTVYLVTRDPDNHSVHVDGDVATSANATTSFPPIINYLTVDASNNIICNFISNVVNAQTGEPYTPFTRFGELCYPLSFVIATYSDVEAINEVNVNISGNDSNVSYTCQGAGDYVGNMYTVTIAIDSGVEITFVHTAIANANGLSTESWVAPV